MKKQDQSILPHIIFLGLFVLIIIIGIITNNRDIGSFFGHIIGSMTYRDPMVLTLGLGFGVIVFSYKRLLLAFLPISISAMTALQFYIIHSRELMGRGTSFSYSVDNVTFKVLAILLLMHFANFVRISIPRTYKFVKNKGWRDMKPLSFFCFKLSTTPCKQSRICFIVSVAGLALLLLQAILFYSFTHHDDFEDIFHCLVKQCSKEYLAEWFFWLSGVAFVFGGIGVFAWQSTYGKLITWINKG